MSLTTIAVELIASALPRAIAPCQSSPMPRFPASATTQARSAWPTTAATMVSTTWLRPRPKTSFLMLVQLRQVELEADDEHQEDDAELGQVRDAGRVAARDGHRVRADQGADREVAEDRRQAREAAKDDAGNGRHEKEESQFERRCHAWRAMREANPRIGRSYWTLSRLPSVSAPYALDASRVRDRALHVLRCNELMHVEVI